MQQWTLKACRINAGYTLREVAKKVNKNFQTISKYEKNSTNIPFELLRDLATLYNVKLDDIFLGDSTKKQNSEINRKAGKP
ncbi:helix-turn-helix domain-containing protein [Streptococcus gallolyticus subsp. gallolyticus]|uniref:helix-turn-helix domain-containing protein n=1 Tax=Streptococcus gallolyticus TaxID=315405 RepID=UPI002283AF2C|nr:helix-turn-helix transcriptional regulator [Streptococcus gallolyticus]MCY7174514.1 helix-turn-helix domain-containing protein [Streptococcus gallolyticus subsp. gallolyticus]MCY7176650.1 helix-turn-helix domain-containing protein [Streptococcus gallolyticus subsp. gallolyticus]MCY7181363.1 helix-turn-helix domain-containing protein [Streptococcus gallolyticus subsp. gallolyticus]MCY7197081.1 helix-turn-helix domain-containing protein [Streptococcus gallolyticus subsp. gallolyticus]MCY72032